MSALTTLNPCHNYFRIPDKNKLMKAIDRLPGLIYIVRIFVSPTLDKTAVVYGRQAFYSEKLIWDRSGLQPPLKTFQLTINRRHHR